MPKGLTRKQKGFVKDYVRTGIGVTSVLNNYDKMKYNTANAVAVENLQKPSIIEAIAVEQKTLADRIPDDLIERVHLEGLNAGRTIYKNNMSSGKVEEVGYEPDYSARHKYLDSAYKLKGSYAAEKSMALNVNVGLDNTDNSQLDSLREEFEQKLKQKFIDGT